MGLSATDLNLILRKGKYHTVRVRLICHRFLHCRLKGALTYWNLQILPWPRPSGFLPPILVFHVHTRQMCSGPLKQPSCYHDKTSLFSLRNFFFSQVHIYCHTFKTGRYLYSVNKAYSKSAHGKSSDLVRIHSLIRKLHHPWPYPTIYALLWVGDGKPPSPLTLLLMLPCRRGYFYFSLNSPHVVNLRISLSVLTFILSTALSMAQVGIIPVDQIRFTRLSKAKAHTRSFHFQSSFLFRTTAFRSNKGPHILV